MQKENKEYFRLGYDNQKYMSVVPDVSIITPTYNRKQNLQNMLISLSQQTYPVDKFEVIVVDDGSYDGTDEMVSHLSLPYRFKYFWQEDRGSRRARARNIGINNARGKIIIFLDSDVLCTYRLVEDHAEMHRKCDNYIVMGLQKCLAEGQGKSLYELRNGVATKIRIPGLKMLKAIVHYHYLKLLEKQGQASLGLTVCTMNASVHKKHLIDINGFDEDFDGRYGCEDMDLGYRLRLNGLDVCWLRKAIVYHQYHPVTEQSPSYDGTHINELILFLKHPEMLQFSKIGIWKNGCYGKTVDQIKKMIG